MNLVIFDGELFFDEKDECGLSSEALEVLGCSNFIKAAVLAGSLESAVRRMTTLIKGTSLRYNVVTEFICMKADYFKRISGLAQLEKIRDIYVVAHVNAPDIYFGNKLGFRTIGILHGNPLNRHPFFPESVPNHTCRSLKDVPELVRPEQSVLSFSEN